jgi:nucleoside permease NupC
MHFLFAAAPVIPHGTLLERGQSLLGLVAFTFLAFLIGRLRGSKTIPWRVVIWGTVLEVCFGAIVLFAPHVLEAVQYAIQRLLDFTLVGVRMIFGSLADPSVPVVDASG